MTAGSGGVEPTDTTPAVRFETLVQHSPVAIVLTDAEAIITWVSPAVTPLLGYEPADVVGSPAADLIHPEDLDAMLHSLGHLLGGSEELDILVVRVHHKNGTWRHVDITATNLLDDPEIGAILVNLRDVTLEVEAQEALAASEERFRALVQHSSDLIFIVQVDGMVTYASPSVEHVLGYSPAPVPSTTAAPGRAASR